MLVITKGYMIYDGIFHGIHVDVHVFFALNIDVQVARWSRGTGTWCCDEM